jgi:hypothetical protein
LFGSDGPSFGPLSDRLAAIEDRLQRIAKELDILSAADTKPANTTEDTVEDEATRPGVTCNASLIAVPLLPIASHLDAMGYLTMFDSKEHTIRIIPRFAIEQFA